MKKLFEVEGNKLINYLSDYRVFDVYDFDNKKRTYFDVEGNKVKPPTIEKYELVSDCCYDDPTCFSPLGNGYYSFTTLPYDQDPDGPFGCFGIKDKHGNVVVEEQYWQIRECFNGLFPVQEPEGGWGCINEKGELIIPCIYWEPPLFNKYGLAYGNNTLVDMEGNEIEDTEFNCIESYYEADRYFPIILTTADQDEQISCTGTAKGMTVDIFDTKLKEYVIKGIPDGTLDVCFYDGDPEPIIAASDMIRKYDKVSVEEWGVIICRKGNHTDVYDYYRQGSNFDVDTV